MDMMPQLLPQVGGAEVRAPGLLSDTLRTDSNSRIRQLRSPRSDAGMSSAARHQSTGHLATGLHLLWASLELAPHPHNGKSQFIEQPKVVMEIYLNHTHTKNVTLKWFNFFSFATYFDASEKYT